MTPPHSQELADIALAPAPPAAIDRARLLERSTWSAFAPRLHIEDPQLLPNAAPVGFADPAAVQTQMKREGYFQATGVDWALDLPLMVGTVRALSAAGLSPVFAFLYDEFWLPFRKLAPVYRGLLGDYAMLPDFWIWNVDPQRGETGWGPHRDKGAASLFADGSPKSLTCWIPLTAATPLNSCMYIVPAMDDRTYGTPNEGTYTFDFQSVRALPARPGDFIVWNQAVLHWGGKTSPRGSETRVSMAIEFQRRDQPPLNQPLLNPAAVLPFEVRLKLIARQILQYRHMYKVPPDIERLALGLIS